MWTPIYSWYEWLPYKGKGLMVANRPWDNTYLLRPILVQQPVRFKLGGRPAPNAHLNVETAGLEPKRP